MRTRVFYVKYKPLRKNHLQIVDFNAIKKPIRVLAKNITSYIRRVRTNIASSPNQGMDAQPHEQQR